MNSASRLDDLSFYSLLAVLQSGMWLQTDIERYLKPFALSHSRFSILLALSENPSVPAIANDLAMRLGVAKPTVTKLVTKLIDDGYVQCEVDVRDSRKKRYSVTKKASALLDRVIPGYVQRLREMTALLSAHEKAFLMETLSKINFLDLKKTLLRQKEKSISEKGAALRQLCQNGLANDIDQVMSYLTEQVDIPTTKLVDFYLGTVDNIEGLRRIEYYLFNGTQIQRNYCTLFFARRNEWRLVSKAYEMGLIDRIQAYSR